MSQSQLNDAKTLIQQQKYDEAYALLIDLDNPIATKWLEKIDEIQSNTDQQSLINNTSIYREKNKRSSGVDIKSELSSTSNYERSSSSKYGALRFFSNGYKFLGYLMIGIVFIAGVVMMLDSFFAGIITIIGGVLAGTSLIATGEFIILFVDIADSNSKQLNLLHRIIDELKR